MNKLQNGLFCIGSHRKRIVFAIRRALNYVVQCIMFLCVVNQGAISVIAPWVNRLSPAIKTFVFLWGAQFMLIERDIYPATLNTSTFSKLSIRTEDLKIKISNVVCQWRVSSHKLMLLSYPQRSLQNECDCHFVTFTKM